MKKIMSVFLAFAMLATTLTACGGSGTGETTQATTGATTQATTQPTVPAVTVEGSMEELVNQVIAERPVEFMGGVNVLDLSDTSEDGLWMIKSCTGLDSAEQITDAAVFEPMIGSLAFSLVMVRVAPDADSKAVAESMKAGIDPRKWICVEADDLKVAGYADVVMLIMVSSTSDMTAQSFVDAFQKVVGAEPEFVI